LGRRRTARPPAATNAAAALGTRRPPPRLGRGHPSKLTPAPPTTRASPAPSRPVPPRPTPAKPARFSPHTANSALLQRWTRRRATTGSRTMARRPAAWAARSDLHHDRDDRRTAARPIVDEPPEGTSGVAAERVEVDGTLVGGLLERGAHRGLRLLEQ